MILLIDLDKINTNFDFNIVLLLVFIYEYLNELELSAHQSAIVSSEMLNKHKVVNLELSITEYYK